jgi:hypothetical protein
MDMGASSAEAPAIAFKAESSPTPRVVTMADMPLMRAYPSAAYPSVVLGLLSAHIYCIYRRTSIEFVDVANPVQATLFDVVQSSEIKISRYSEYGSYVDLVDTTEEILQKDPSVSYH